MSKIQSLFIFIFRLTSFKMDDVPSPVPLRNRANMSDEEYEKAREEACTYFSVDRMSHPTIQSTLNVSRQFVRRCITIIICKLLITD